MEKEQEVLNIKRRINEIESSINSVIEKETESTSETLNNLRQELLELNDKLNSLMEEKLNNISHSPR
ncbi:MAG: hypothetical protein IKP79_02580 [Bacilli bacterium]|nr:hypothetical protein [Bacilli bacterium]